MKNTLLILAGILFFAISCDKETTDSDILDEWLLIEVLNDPGDGSGTFQAVSSNKTITFFADGYIECDGFLCNNSTTSNTVTSGTYSLVDSTINGANCNAFPFNIVNGYLILSYVCIEPCQAKFEKL